LIFNSSVAINANQPYRILSNIQVGKTIYADFFLININCELILLFFFSPPSFKI